MIKIPENSIRFFKDNFDEIINSGNLAEGKWTEKICKYSKEICGVKHATATASNGSGLMAVLHILKHYFERDSVLIQANTMYGMKTMVQSSGYKIVGFINSDISTLMPKFNDLKHSIEEMDCEPEKVVVFLSHLGGIINPDIIKIADYCKKNRLILIEDCAHSFGATLNGRHSGTFGEAGVFSFYATKAIPAGEGGIVITNNSNLGNKIKKYVIYDRFDQELSIGVNIRPSEVHALFMYSVISEYLTIIEQKKTIANKYKYSCNSKNIKFIDQDINGHDGNYYKFVIFSDDLPIKEKYPNLITKTSGIYDYSLDGNTSIPEHHACLPIWYDQSTEITDKVISEIETL